MYFKIRVESNGYTTEEIVEVANREQAEQKKKELIDYLLDGPRENTVKVENLPAVVEEIGIADCVEYEERNLLNAVERWYVSLYHDLDAVTIRDYQEFLREKQSDPLRYKWQVLKEINSWLRKRWFFRKTCDLTKLSVAVQDETIKHLFRARDDAEYERICNEVILKYGDEIHRRRAEKYLTEDKPGHSSVG